MSQLDIDQEKLIEHKFKRNFNNKYQLFDSMSEVLVAYRYLSKKPKFGNDTNGEVDIYLEVDDFYIEVKTLNNSDLQNNIISSLEGSGGSYVGSNIINLYEEKRIENIVIKKAKELIEKACKQLYGKRGVIVLVYNLDVLIYLKSQKIRESNFLDYINNEVILPTKISLFLIKKDDLFGGKY